MSRILSEGDYVLVNDLLTAYLDNLDGHISVLELGGTIERIKTEFDNKGYDFTQNTDGYFAGIIIYTCHSSYNCGG